MSNESAPSSGATGSSRRRRLAEAARALVLAAVPAAAGAADSGVVLEYHHVAEDTPPATSVTPATFEAHMDHLADSGFHVWPLPRLVRALQRGDEVPERTVAITFDDAYASVYSEVFPRLRARGWPFTVFVAPGYIDRDYDGFTTWEQLREMEASGATIANHSLDHPHMVARPPGVDRARWLERMRAQVTEAQRRLDAELADPARLFAWPFGEFSPPLQEMLADAGFVGFGQQSGAVGPASDFTALPRFPLATAFASLDSFALKVRARPLPVAGVRPDSGVLPPDARRPPLELSLAEGPYQPDRVRCYVGGGIADIERGSTPRRLTVRPARPLGPGRTKINCTAPATDGDQWFWYSHVWMKPNPDGSWYAD